MFRSASVILIAVMMVPSNREILEFPAFAIAGTNILIGITENGAVVSGRYRFYGKPNVPPKPPFYGRRATTVLVPVPIPASLRKFDEIDATVRPFITLKGTRYHPVRGVSFCDAPSLPREAKIALFVFIFQRDDLEEAFDLLVQFEQPVIPVGGKELIYFVPFVPPYAKYEQEKTTPRAPFSVTFESYGATLLQLTDLPMKVERSKPQMIVVSASTDEIIAVEKKRPNKAPEPTPGSVTPRAISGDSK